MLIYLHNLGHEENMCIWMSQAKVHPHEIKAVHVYQIHMIETVGGSLRK